MLIKLATFPVVKTLEQFDFEAAPGAPVEVPTEAAIAALYQAIALDPENATAYAFLAEAYVDYGALERAIDAAETAITLDETDYNVQRNYGYVAQYALGDFDTAIQSYERAQQLAPTRGYIALDLVAMYRRDGRSDQAVTMLESIIERNPENGTAYAELARVLLADLGEREKARDAAERCIAVAPNNISCLSFLGSLQLVAGEYNLCARTLDRAIQAVSSNALDYQYAGTCYIVIDDCVRAREILLEGMDLAKEVTCSEAYQFNDGVWELGKGYPDLSGEQRSYKVVAYDFGIKRNILRNLVSSGCEVTVVPAETSAEEVLAMKPDGVFLRNCPGDPEPPFGAGHVRNEMGDACEDEEHDRIKRYDIRLQGNGSRFTLFLFFRGFRSDTGQVDLPLAVDEDVGQIVAQRHLADP